MNFIKSFLNLLSLKDKYIFYFFVFGAILNVFLEVLSIGMVVPLIGLILNPDKLILNLVTFFPNLELFHFENQNLGSQYVYYFLVIFFVIFLIKNTFIFFYFYFQNKFVQKIETNLSQRILKKYLFQNYVFFLKNNPTNLITKLTADLLTFTRGFVGPLITLISEVMIIFGFISIIIFFNLLEVGLIFLIFFVFGAILLRVIGNFAKEWGKKRKNLDNEKLSILNNTFLNIKTIILDNKYYNLLNRFEFTANKLADLQRKIITTNIVPKISFEILGILSIVIVLIYLISADYNRDYIITTTGFFIAVAYRVIPSFQKIIFAYQTISFGKIVLENIENDLNLQEEVFYSDNKIGFKQNIELKNIYFKHNDRSKSIFEKANITIKKGEIVGIYGESGVGKSTLVDIISGISKPNSGEIIIDNKLVNNPKLVREWQNEISYVTQHTLLFNDTIKNNIIFSGIEKNVKENLLIDVIEEAQLNDFINSLPNKLETSIEELGVNLSGGQKQRLGIARALYKEPKFLIFDEATNALDAKSEDLILDTIFGLKSKITIIIISHKKELIKKCDSIFKIDNKKINLVSQLK